VEFLKTLFTIKAAQSYWPLIRPLAFTSFVQEWNIHGSDFDLSASERAFIAVTKNAENTEAGGKAEKDMSRWQFYEALVRIADFKYR
jgi:hypothetical protein